MAFHLPFIRLPTPPAVPRQAEVPQASTAGVSSDVVAATDDAPPVVMPPHVPPQDPRPIGVFGLLSL